MKIPRWTLVTVPVACFCFGFALNAIVMAANGGSMPVLMPQGHCELIDADDIIHSCWSSSVHLRFLADWVVIRGLGVASPGDFFEWFAGTVGGPSLIAWAALILQKAGIIGD
jgi:hypothetical protein